MLHDSFLNLSESQHLICVLGDPHLNPVDINSLFIHILLLLNISPEALLIYSFSHGSQLDNFGVHLVVSLL
jgi:hypothetical protein